jgi:hypothetical protein
LRLPQPSGFGGIMNLPNSSVESNSFIGMVGCPFRSA